MNRRCDRTDDVLDATREAALSGDLAVHAAGCASCADALLVESLLAADREVAAGQAAERLPDPSVVWWRAQLLERRRAAARATSPILVMETLAGAAGVALVLLGLGTLAPAWTSWSGSLQALWSAPLPPDGGMVAAFTGLGLLFLARCAYTSWAED